MASLSERPTPDLIDGNLMAEKYDRQLRLWGTTGQAALATSHVIALGATAAMAEALKCLLISGVGAVSIVDDRCVSDEDVAVNFFVGPTAAQHGVTIASAMAVHLRPLNEDCVVRVVEQQPRAWAAAWVRSVQAAWRAGAPFDVGPEETSEGPVARGPALLLVSEYYADMSALSALVQTCRYQADIPVVLVRSSGFIGLIQVYAADRVVVRPQAPKMTTMEDLRIFNPFPALRRWFEQHQPLQVEKERSPAADDEHSTTNDHDDKLPYLCLLYHAFLQWWAALPPAEQLKRLRPVNSASSPSSIPLLALPRIISPLKEDDYRDMKARIPGLSHGNVYLDEGYHEAMTNCTMRLNRPYIQSPPTGLQQLMRDARCAAPEEAIDEMLHRLCDTKSTPPSLFLESAAAQVLFQKEDVLVWFILHSIVSFMKGDIGAEAEVDDDGGAACRNAAVAVSVALQGIPASPRPVVGTAVLPHSGHVPDIATSTALYRQLHDLYTCRHKRDVSLVADAAWDTLCKCVQKKWASLTPSSVSTAGATNGGHATATAPGPTLPAAVRQSIATLAETVVCNEWNVSFVAFSEAYTIEATASPHNDEVVWRRRLALRFRTLISKVVGGGSGGLNERAPELRSIFLALAFISREELMRRQQALQSVELAAKEASATPSLKPLPSPSFREVLAEAETLLSITGVTEEGHEVSADEHQRPPWAADQKEGVRSMLVKCCIEVSRWKRGVQLPSVAASAGALAAQEVLKLLMRVHVPCGEPLLYDGYSNCVVKL